MRVSHFGEFFTNLREDSFTRVNIDPGDAPGNAVKSKVMSALIGKYPDGARGTIFFPHRNGNHFFNWDISDGKVRFTDAQRALNDASCIFDAFDHKMYRSNGHGITCIRLDDLDINADRIQSVVKNAGEKVSRSAEKFDVYVTRGSDFVAKWT